MHRSRVVAASVDVPDSDYQREVGFWSGALGATAESDDEDPDYVFMGEATHGIQFYVQRVGAPGRVHLDIESDDVEAEVLRLEALGATRVEKVKTWWVMRDPAGLLFCVVRVQMPEVFERYAHTWES